MDALVAWLWQGSVLTVSVAVALRVLPRASAVTRHLVWWVALGCVMALPAWHVARQPGVDPGSPAGYVPRCSGSGAAPPAVTAPPGLAAASAPCAAPPAGADATLAASAAWVLPAPPAWVVALVLGAWLGVVLLLLTRVSRGIAHVRRLASGGTPMSSGREARLRLWMRDRGTGRPMDLRVSREVGVPCALGLGRATILVPHLMMARLSDEDLDQLVMHERAHLLRYDDWTRLAEAIVWSVAGAHPAVSWMCRQIDLERETACDDLVVKATGDAHGYATCLAGAASALLSPGLPRSPVLAPGALRSRGVLERRVGRLVDRRRNGRTAPSRVLVLASACGLIAASELLVQASPLVRFVDAGGGNGIEWAAAPAPLPPADPARAGLGLRATPPQPPGQPPARPPVTNAPGPAARATSSRGNPRAAEASPSGVPGEVATLPRLPGAEAPQPSAPAEQQIQLPAVLPVDVGIRPTAVDLTATPSSSSAAGARRQRGPWSDVAQAGGTVGAGTKKAGLAVASFFARAGQAVGGSF
jgi:beta-lactamase regulating signal transducer with metallopeptidase domain